jgi:lycopene cyclase domain-containing protein
VTYTWLSLIGVVVAVVLDLAVLRTALLRRRAFWTAYAIVLCFQLVTNGWLTGRDIVTYDPDAIVGARLVFAPVEDLLFGFSLVVQTLAWWVWWGRRLSGRDGPAATPALRRAAGG